MQEIMQILLLKFEARGIKINLYWDLIIQFYRTVAKPWRSKISDRIVFKRKKNSWAFLGLILWTRQKYLIFLLLFTNV